MLFILGLNWQTVCVGAAAGNSLVINTHLRSLRLGSIELRGGGDMPPTTRASKVAVAGVDGGTDSVSSSSGHVLFCAFIHLFPTIVMQGLAAPMEKELLRRLLDTDEPGDHTTQFGNVYESTSEMWQKELNKANPESQKVMTLSKDFKDIFVC